MIDYNKIIISIILGIIEGITEFLPISSTCHIIIITHWLNIENKNTKILEIFIQLGSSLATLILLHKKIIKIFRLENLKKNKNKIKYIYKSIYKSIYILTTSNFPTIIVGLIFYHTIKSLTYSNHLIYGLIFGGLFLIFSEIFKPKKNITKSLKKIKFFQLFIIGLMQTLSLYPGFSRSGSTIASGILLGLHRSIAIDFSFIISIPLIFGASILELIKNIKDINLLNFPYYWIAFFVSFIVSLSIFKVLINFLKKISLNFFGIYRILLAIVIYFIN